MGMGEREQLELEYNRKQKALDREDAIKKSDQKRLDEREQLELEYNRKQKALERADKLEQRDYERKIQTAELSKAQNNPKVTTAFLACMREKEDLLAHTIPGMRAGLDDVIRYCEVRA